MARFVVKNLPPHWIFVPSRRRVRDWIDRLKVDVRCVEYGSTAYKPREEGLLLGFIESRFVDGNYCFYLQFWGLPEGLAGPIREGLSHRVLEEIEKFIRRPMTERPSESGKPTQKTLSFKINGGEILWSGGIELVDRYGFSSGTWWTD